jgi:hypothetical protein
MCELRIRHVASIAEEARHGGGLHRAIKVGSFREGRR